MFRIRARDTGRRDERGSDNRGDDNRGDDDPRNGDRENEAVIAAAAEVVAAVTARVRGTLVWTFLRNLGRVGVTDRAMTLAAQAFTSILPVMIVITAAPLDGPIERSMDRISTQWLALQPGTPLTADAPTASFGVLGALMTLISATSFSRALDRMYADVWGTRKLGAAGWWRWPLVIIVFVAGITAEVFVVRSWPYSQATVAETVLSFLLWAVLWAAVTRLLTARHLAAQQVLVTGAIAGGALTLFFLATQLGFGPLLAGAEERYGTLGVVFSVIGWLFVYAWLVVASTVFAHAVTTRPTADEAADG